MESEKEFLEDILHTLELCYNHTPTAYASEVRISVQNRLADLERNKVLICEETNHCTFKLWNFKLNRYECACNQKKYSR
jgi:hypothetical protein